MGFFLDNFDAIHSHMNEESKKDNESYTPPTREALVRSVLSDGNYSARCKRCGNILYVGSLKDLANHKCDKKK